ncbi:MAG: sigma-70 family RNA polymerase sigma factor [Pirellulaceae bacterium]|nr:sigma-70 family RNA polymerase sigma factor [Pirellulaceae bacterium]
MNAHDPKFDTRISLLERLQGTGASDASWQEFVSRYANLLKSWCRHWGVGSADIDDVVQETLIAVVSSLPSFEHRGAGSFRGWMKTIARRCFAQLIKHYQRNPAAGAATIDASELACEKLVDSFDQEAQRELFALSAQAVKQRVAESTWLCFEMSAIQGMSGAEVANALGLNVSTVYVARGRVQRMISETIAELDAEVQT